MKTCKICGKEFVKKGNNQIFCSVSCRWKDEYRIKLEKKKAKQQHRPPQPCAYCQKLFVPKSYKVKYCSHECFYKAMLKRQIDRRRSIRPKADVMTIVKCPKCEKTRLEQGRYDRAAREFCQECKVEISKYAEGL